MNENQQQLPQSESSPGIAIRKMIAINIHDAKLIFELCKSQGCLNSKEFIDWQDKLNEISVRYE